MVSVCFYFQVHQPSRLRKYQVFDIGKNHDYFDHDKNESICKKISQNCYLKTNKIMLDLIKANKGKFKISFSITGSAIEQFENYAPEVIDSFKELAKTGCVEFIAETYYHSLSFVYSKDEFKRQVEMHQKKIEELFGVKPKIFRNTELIYNNELAQTCEEMGFEGIFAEGADHILGWRSPNYLYLPSRCKKIKTFLKNYKLSDDLAFRFSNKNWEEWPLNPEKYAKWICGLKDTGEIINLFMDYETFGEHQWEESGIFDFLKLMPHAILEKNIDFVLPSEAIERFKGKGELDIPNYISWADNERDISAWVGNPMQENAVKELYMLEEDVKKSNDKKLIEDWSKLTTSDHLYYMCTKHLDDGNVHSYFNPYDSPYEAFILFMNVLNDVILRINSTKSND